MVNSENLEKELFLVEDLKSTLNRENNFSKQKTNNDEMRVLSLFANIGVAEAYLDDIGFKVVVANELENRRAELYQKIYPSTEMICGNILEDDIFFNIIKKSKELNVGLIIATPPCQGMSTAGQQKNNDKRNSLIIPTILAIEKINPKYALIENVPQFLKTTITYNESKITITDLLNQRLGKNYNISLNLINSKNYAVPQSRERAIILLTRKDQNVIWNIPKPVNKIITVEEAIGHLPPLDPFIKDASEKELLNIFPFFYERQNTALNISKWHKPPSHIKRQVIAMQYTPTGKTAFNNIKHKPQKENGEFVKGFQNTYKRQNWDTSAYTITMDNVKISSQNNVHPGRYVGKDENENEIYSDPRALTLYEIMKLMSIPDNWNIPKKTSEAFIRRVIGEGIPPMMIKMIFEELKKTIKKGEKKQ
jgi:DNA (cytosine-5)-methyltransferase 1